MAYCVSCLREYPNAGPRLNRTYVNVIRQSQIIGESSQSFDEWASLNPNDRRLDPANNEFLIEVPVGVFNQLQTRAESLFHDDFRNLPKWQQRTATSGADFDSGSFADPQDAGSAFTSDQELPDDRFILRLYDKDPVANGDAVHLANEEFLENDVQPRVSRYLRLFDSNDQPINRNVGNDRIVVGGRLLDLDWGSSSDPPLSAGVALINLLIRQTNDYLFPSDAGYRILGPEGETQFRWTVYTKDIGVAVV